MAANAYKNYFSNLMSNFQPAEFNAFKSLSSKNMEACTAANQVVLEGMQAIARRQAEVIQQSAQRSFECFKRCASSPTPEELQRAHSELMHEVVENVSNNVREMMEMSSKAALEFFDICNKRAAEITTELCSSCQPQQKNDKK
jgi:phasin family protein